MLLHTVCAAAHTNPMLTDPREFWNRHDHGRVIRAVAIEHGLGEIVG